MDDSGGDGWEPSLPSGAGEAFSAKHGFGEAEAAADGAVADADEFVLAHEFYDAYKACSELQKADSGNTEQSDLDILSRKLKAIACRVNQLRLFSPNEELEEISTADLKFLLVPHLLAEVSMATRDLDSRPSALRNGLIFLRAFAADCERLEVAHADDLKAIDRSPEETAHLDGAARRDEKLDRYRRSKDLDTKVAHLFALKREHLGDEFLWGAGGNFDEDDERALIMGLLGRAVATAVDGIASAQQELPLLEMMIARGGLDAPRWTNPEPPAEKPFFVRIQDKAELHKMYEEMVFQCPFAQPTMTLAEFADNEMYQMQEQQQSKFEAQQRQQHEEADRWWNGDRQGKREEDEDEAGIYKARDWDDWKDEHPWGSGNRMANVS